MMQIAQCARKKNHEIYTCCSAMRSNKQNADLFTYFIGRRFFRKIFEFIEIYSGLDGFLHFFATLNLIHRMKKKHCSLIHLHNLHGNYINYPLLFRYIKKNNIPVIWTLHDCWSFTGRCPYFDLVKCKKWMHGCSKCPYPAKQYPRANVDMARFMWNCKKSWFTGLKKCTLVTPSNWLAGLLSQSYLKDYPVRVIRNGINLSVFSPVNSDFREQYNITGKKIILGVAFGWGKRKGLDVFVDLATRLSDDYRIVLVGTDSNVDDLLPANIISIHRTQNQAELAKIYSAADVFVNPTREEVLGMVNIEALACGTPVITFKTGGSPECIDEYCGSVVDCNDIDAMESEIRRVCEKRPYTKESCVNRAKLFNMDDCFDAYVKMYDEEVKSRS